MNAPLRVLVIEDEPFDFKLLENFLRHHEITAELRRIDSYAELDAALQEDWDIVLSDYNVPGMDFRTTLRRVQEKSSDLPVILVSGTTGEELAVDLLHLGLSDFILKDRLARLPDAIRRALAEVNARRVNKLAEMALIESEGTLRRERDEQAQLVRKLEEAQDHLLQSDKMASIGQLAAGVAHEINNPIGYVSSNLGSLEQYVEDTFSLLDLYEQAENSITDSEVREKINAAKKKLDIDFLKKDLRDLMIESKDGITRVKKIVQNLKDFAHVDISEQWQICNLHKGLDSTLNVVNNEIKYKAELIKHYGDIPDVECLSSQINQVFMNLLVNAAHAIEERGVITVSTGTQSDEVWVSIADTGSGIAPENLKKIFDPFFTTKPLGKGTGLGLSLSYNIIKKHHGRIEVQSELGKGTTFQVWLPIIQPHDGTE